MISVSSVSRRFGLVARFAYAMKKKNVKKKLCSARTQNKTRRLKSFPWDALVYGSIMAFYLNLEKVGKPERCHML